MLTRPQPYEAEAEDVTHEAEARTHEAGAEAEAEAEDKFLRRQSFEKPKHLQRSISKY